MKRYLGIPAVGWILLATVGVVAAWYLWGTITTTTTVQEPLSTANEVEFSTTMYPGQTNVWTWQIVNVAPVAYDIKADLTYSAPSGVTITSFMANGTNETADLTDDGSAEFVIPANGTISCSLTITAAGDAAPGVVDVSLDFSRE